MSKYGRVTEFALELLKKKELTPFRAWEISVIKVFPNSKSSQNKSCPKSTFLALCELGIIPEIQKGIYTRSIKNKLYANKAISLLKSNISLINDEKLLWKQVIDGTNIQYNQQMSVVIVVYKMHLKLVDTQ